MSEEYPLGFDIIAFTKDWKWKGRVEPAKNVGWIRAESAFDFIKNNKPEGEYWLVKIVEQSDFE